MFIPFILIALLLGIIVTLVLIPIVLVISVIYVFVNVKKAQKSGKNVDIKDIKIMSEEYINAIKIIRKKDISAMDYIAKIKFLCNMPLAYMVDKKFLPFTSKKYPNGYTYLANSACIGETIRAQNSNVHWADYSLPTLIFKKNGIPLSFSPFENIISFETKKKALVFSSEETINKSITKIMKNYQYTTEEMEALSKFYEEKFGEIKNVFHETVLDKLHIDIYHIEAKNKDYNYLITSGMGAYVMDIPAKALKVGYPSRMELVLKIAKDYPLDNSSWVISMLQQMAHWPIMFNTWLGTGHSVEFPEYFGNTNFKDFLLMALTHDKKCITWVLGKKKSFALHQVIPIYENERIKKLNSSTEELLEQFEDKEFVLDENRPCYGEN